MQGLQLRFLKDQYFGHNQRSSGPPSDRSSVLHKKLLNSYFKLLLAFAEPRSRRRVAHKQACVIRLKACLMDDRSSPRSIKSTFQETYEIPTRFSSTRSSKLAAIRTSSRRAAASLLRRSRTSCKLLARRPCHQRRRLFRQRGERHLDGSHALQHLFLRAAHCLISSRSNTCLQRQTSDAREQFGAFTLAKLEPPSS